MWTAHTIIKNKDKKWTNDMRKKAKEVIQQKKELYRQIKPSSEAKKQFREARMICKKKGVSIR